MMRHSDADADAVQINDVNSDVSDSETDVLKCDDGWCSFERPLATVAVATTV